MRARRVATPSGGFTLVEAVIALILSSFVLLLVSTTFLVQNRYYSTQLERARAQDNTRTATDMIAREVRSALGVGFAVAGARTLTVRGPIAVGTICSRDASTRDDVHFGSDWSNIDPTEITGIALRRSDGSMDAYATTWTPINGGTLGSSSNCAASGADVTGVEGSFRRLLGLQGFFSPSPQEGDVVLLFGETTFEIRTSVMNPNTLGLFRSAAGGTPIEFATGMDTTAQFQYRTGGTNYADTVDAASIHLIDAVRLVADARRPAVTGATDDLTFGWSVNVAPRIH